MAATVNERASAPRAFYLISGRLPPFYRPELFLGRGVLAVLLFAGPVTAGVVLRRRPARPKRLMLCASIASAPIAPQLVRAIAGGGF